MFIVEGITNGYWTSGVRGKSSPELFWFVNGKPLVYSKFFVGQPDNFLLIEGCVEVFVYQKEIFWNDFVCDRKIGYICQKYVWNLTCESTAET